ncbi:type VII secretion target [Segniliparus rotundus]|nr:type VII secretion target [Segniliparus rotundus]
MGNPDGVRQLGDLWSQASGGLHDQAARIRASRLRPEHFGPRYAEQAGGVREGFEQLAGTWSSWGGHCEGYGGNLHAAVDSYTGTDEGNAADLDLNL